MFVKAKAAVLFELNTPLVIEELEVPALKAEQVLVKLAYSGVCHSQLMEVRGERGFDRYLPHLLGHEGSGTVLEVGKKVTKVKPGDHVALTWIRGSGAEISGTQYKKADTIFHAGRVTTFNDHAVISENRCVKIQKNIPLDIAALFGCAVLTGAGIVLNDIKPEINSSILIWGVGGVGLSAVMAAIIAECSLIIALDTKSENLQLATDFGATHCIDVTKGDAIKRIHEIVGDQGVKYAVEAAGKTSTIESAFQAIQKSGGVCVFASHPPAGEKICLDPHDLISGKQIRGSWGGGSQPDSDLPIFVDYYMKGKLPLEKLIGRMYSLEQVNLALDELEREARGRSLIRF